jgi:hypothetical protein
MNSSSCLKLFAAILATVAAPVFAHHGWDGNGQEELELTGIVETPVSLSGPHATMSIRVAGQLWDVTLAPPARTERLDLKRRPSLSARKLPSVAIATAMQSASKLRQSA